MHLQIGKLEMLNNITRSRPSPQFTPEQVAAFAASIGAMINVGIEMLDVLAGDPDDEESDEDQGHDEAEPDFLSRFRGEGPGCLIADNDYGAEEAGEREEF
jgi:hypothetical protein